MVSAKKTERERQGWLGFLSSNQLAIYTLIALGIVTLIGTVLPQRGPGLSEPEYARLADMGGGWTAAARLGLLDIFHSIWFYALIAILCANLIACTILNFRRVYKTNTTKTLKFGPDALNQFEHLQTFKAGDLDGAKIASMIKPGRREKIDDGEYFFAESGDLHRYGAIITHFAILILAAGAIYGAALGIDGSMIIPEGEQSGTLQLRRGGELELPFQVRCNDFTLEHYENSRQPKTFRSELTYIPASGDAWDTTIEVNHPAAFGGFRFFQSSYGQMQPRLVVGVTRRADGNSLGELPVQIKRTYEVPGASAHFSVQDVADNKFNQGLAALIRETKPDAPPADFWIFLKNPSFDETRGGEFIYRLADIRTGEYYTGLMVTRNPGVNIVWLGSALGGVGLFLAFFLPHRRTIVRLADGKITLGYTDSRARDVSEEKFAELVERFGGRTKSSENKKA